MLKLMIRLSLLLCLLLPVASFAAGGGSAPSEDVTILPFQHLDYKAMEQAKGIDSLGQTLMNRIQANPFNLVASIIFLLAILHTFMAGKFQKIAHDLEEKHRKQLLAQGKLKEAGKKDSSFSASIMHFFGEVEAIFGIWCVPLMLSIIAFYGWGSATYYIDNVVHYTEPMFVVVIMAISSTKPVLKFSSMVLGKLAGIGGGKPKAWWYSILIVAPLLGSFITEPAAMTIAALMLGGTIFSLDPSPKFKYATLGLLFVNISVGGTLTHFAAPPVLMVAGSWGWDLLFMLTHFGWKAVIGIIMATVLYGFYLRKEFPLLEEKAVARAAKEGTEKEEPIPFWITAVILGFMAWTVFNLHSPPLFIGGFLFFLAFVHATATHQDAVSIKGPLLVGFFLAGLVTHGAMQQWWIAPVLSQLGDLSLFKGATILTAFNDNAAITFLASQVPEFNGADMKQYAVVAGAVTGGGLTVIANAPNPAGQSILSRYFSNGISPLGLLLGALVPTIIMGLCFMLIR